MADPSSVASNGGIVTAVVALTIALAEYLKNKNAKALVKKLENAAPSPVAPMALPDDKEIVFEKSRVTPSIDMIARVETYVRAEGELRIQLAQKDWELKEMREQHDAVLIELTKAKNQIEGLRRELDDLHRQIQSGHSVPLQSRNARTAQPTAGRDARNLPLESGRDTRDDLRVDRTQDRKVPRKKYPNQDD